MSLHLSPQAELQSHLCDWCWLWISPSPPPACLFPGYSHFLLGENDNLELLRGDTAEFLYLPLLPLILWPVQRANTNQYPQLLKPTKTYGLFCAVFHNHIIFWQWLHRLLLREKEQFLWETNWKAKLWSWSSPGKTWMWWLQAEKCYAPWFACCGQVRCRAVVPVSQVPHAELSSMPYVDLLFKISRIFCLTLQMQLQKINCLLCSLVC